MPLPSTFKRLRVRPDEILPGDRFTARSGPYGGMRMVVVDVVRGRYSNYRLLCRPLEYLDVGADYSELIEVERRGE